MTNPFDPKKELESWERAKIAVSAPHYEELRQMLGLPIDKFCKLVDVDEKVYWKWKSGVSQPGIDQMILFRKIYDIARKKGLIFSPNALD